jgi:phosphogluconate dehydratase
MPTGISNDEKAKVRQLYAEGKVGRAELLESEAKSYHSPGTCTFYGTANSNQMLMEIMGLHLPGASFVNPGTPLREALTREAAVRALSLTAEGNSYTPIGHIIDEKAIVNGLVGLNATGGSTNHTIHLIAIAAAAGLQVTWQDMSDLSEAVPLLARVYPNGIADVNHFHAAGGMGFLIRELLDGGYLHEDVKTVFGNGLSGYAAEAKLIGEKLVFEAAPAQSGDPKVLATAKAPFQASGGLKLLSGNLGRSVIKVSAVKPEHRLIEAPARIFHSQQGLQAAFKAGELNGDMIAVVRFAGPKAIGMPELHNLTPALAVLQGKGYRVALVTDGRMSGASGKVPAAIHLTPEAVDGGPISKLRDGDMLRLDADAGTLEFLGDEKELLSRTPATEDLRSQQIGTGRELFAGFRRLVTAADQGAIAFGM